MLWEEIQQIVQAFSGEKYESTALISMLKCLPELSSIFGVDKSDFLVQQCFSGINRKDFKVRVQVLRTLGSLSLRVGA